MAEAGNVLWSMSPVDKVRVLHLLTELQFDDVERFREKAGADLKEDEMKDWVR